MRRIYFGTDGVRGTFGGPLINPEFAERLGSAVGRWLRGAPGAAAQPVVLVGRDSRESGPVLEAAIAGGLEGAGCAVRLLGVLPTPAVARAVRRSGAALGVVITASHNPAADNGLKFFGPGGRKLSDEQEAAIEATLPAKPPVAAPPALPPRFGPDAATPSARADYVAAAAALLPVGALGGWRIVLDTANGATAGTSPSVLRALGAEVVGLGAEPDGRNINADVGSEHPAAMAALVRKTGARLGIAHDGDGDRCILCDERGELLDGDEMLTILATHALRAGRLAARTLVVTVHSNLGVDAAVTQAGGRVVRTAVGDRYVAEGMLAAGATLGGESSGHLIFSELSPTGDGLVAALKVIEVMLETGQPLSVLRTALRKFPQASAAVPARVKIPLAELPELAAATRALETELGGRGRVLVRYSGTEPTLRILVEGPDEAQVKAGLARLKAAARAELG